MNKRILLIMFVLILSVMLVYGVTKITAGGNEKNLPIGGGEIIVKNSTNGLFTIITESVVGDVQIARSIDGGDTWNITLLDPTRGTACQNDMSLLINSSDDLHAFCSKDHILHWYSIDSGTTWTAEEDIWDDGDIDFATVVIDGNDNIYGCYYNLSRNGQVYAFNSSQTNTDGSGGTWSTTKIGDNVKEAVAGCDLEVDNNNNVHLVYYQAGNISYSNLTAGSGIWTPPINITEQENTPSFPSIVITSNNNISVAWNYEKNEPERINLSYANSSDFGTTWSVNQSIVLGGTHEQGLSMIRDIDDNIFIFALERFLNLTANSSIYSGWSDDYVEINIGDGTDQVIARGSSFPIFNSYANITERIDYVYVATNETPDQIFYNFFEIGAGDEVNVILVTPANNNVTTETTIDFNCDASTNLGRDIDNVTFLLWDSTPTLEAKTFRDLINSPTQSESFNVLALLDDVYEWNCEYIDEENLVGFASSNSSLTVDNTIPQVSVIDTKNIFSSVSVPLNYTFNETNPQACVYSLDNGVTNTSFASCGANVTLAASVGDNTVIVYINDTVGNVNSSTHGFTVVTNFTIQFNNVSEATTQPFSLLLGSFSANFSSATLNYNGTSYGDASSVANGTGLNLTRSIITPLLNPNGNFTLVNWWWNATLFRGLDYINISSSRDTQEVHRQLVTSCDTNTLLETWNFTAVDELDTSKRLNITANTEITVWKEISGSGRTYNFATLNSTNATEVDFCIYPDWNELTANIKMLYSMDGYPVREYNRNSISISNETINVTLSLLASASATEITVQIRDQNDNDLVGFLVEAQEYDSGAGTFTLRDSELSNPEGKVYFNLQVTGTEYQFRVKDVEGMQIWESGTPFELQETSYLFRLPIGLIRPSEDILAIDAFIGSTFLDYVNSTRRVTYSWTNTSQMGHTCLTIYNRTQGGDIIISNQCSPLNNGTLNYTLGATWDGYFVGIANVSLLTKVGDFLTYHVDSVSIDFRETIKKFGREGLLYAGIIIGSLASVGLAIGSGTIAILLMIVGLMATTAIGFINVSWTLTIGMIIIGLFIILKMARG